MDLCKGNVSREIYVTFCIGLFLGYSVKRKAK